MDNCRPIYKTFRSIAGDSFNAADVHRSIEDFVKTTFDGLPENIDGDVIITLPDGTSLDVLYIVYREPNDIRILGFDKNGDEIITSIPYRSINLSISFSPLKAGKERIEVRFQLEDGETELTSSQQCHDEINDLLNGRYKDPFEG